METYKVMWMHRDDCSKWGEGKGGLSYETAMAWVEEQDKKHPYLRHYAAPDMQPMRGGDTRSVPQCDADPLD